MGASPALALEAARAGYRVLVASNNPILSFITETLAGAPKSADFQSALAELAMARRGDERLEHHLQSLYLTECDTCGENRSRRRPFFGAKAKPNPSRACIDCPKCGQSGEHPITQADLDRLKAMGGDRLQRARALQRVILNEDEHRADVEEALENYLPRPLYVLFTLANKIEGMGLPPERLRLLQALLISVFDQGSTLWPWPGGRARPKQLTIPPQFRENNLWLALEDAAREWAQPARPGHSHPLAGRCPPEGSGGHLPVPRAGKSADAAASGNRLARRADRVPSPQPGLLDAFRAVVRLAVGRRGGPAAAQRARPAALRLELAYLGHPQRAGGGAVGTCPPEIPFFGLLPELAPGFLSAVIVACEAAGFRLEGLALRSEQELAQGLWRPSGGTARAGRTANRRRRTAGCPRALTWTAPCAKRCGQTWRRAMNRRPT